MAEPSRRPRRILIADDVSDIRSFMMQLLTREGYEAVEAHDGALALALIKEGKIDLAVLDIVMPGLNGVEVVKEVRGLPLATPIILLTGLVDVELAVEGLRAGANEVLTKPVAQSDLLTAIKTVLENPKPPT